MSELVPIPLDLQLRRAFFEFERERRIFDLPREKFFCGLPGLDTSVVSNGHRASTPLGPAAGPHTQLLQNIVLCWLGGARIIELKTVQILDELKIPRPCIDATNVTYNVEWSQELRLEQSLREYVAASMFLEILKRSDLLGEDFPARASDTIFDMSVGYNLEGIRSPRIRAWLAGMKDARALIDELRTTLSGRFAQYRDLEFSRCISDTVTLSTFHGCPAEEIEGIVTFLLTEMGLNVCVKMNPTLLGREHIEHLLHDVLGYRDIALTDGAFAKDMKFEDALDLVPRLERVARAHGRQLSLKFSNTLVVRNHRPVFHDELMYMSGAPLHVLTLNLVKRFREQVAAPVPLSFSAGLNAHNFANVVAMNFVPATTCTDLLKPGGYGRLHKYMENLGARMREVGATSISQFVLRYAGQGEAAVERVAQKLEAAVAGHESGTDAFFQRAARTWVRFGFVPAMQDWLRNARRPLGETCLELTRKIREHGEIVPDSLVGRFSAALVNLEQMLVDEAGLLNTPVLVERATADPRYRHEQNQTVPRKIGTPLALNDCTACDKCVPVCPNDANFEYGATPVEISYSNYELLPGGAFQPIAGGTFKISKSRQWANYADACNDCGNCDVFCPEDGGPNVAKPRFFGRFETYRAHAGTNGFYIEYADRTRTIHGNIGGKSYRLVFDATADCARFSDGAAEYLLQPSRNALLSWSALPGAAAPQHLDMLPYLQLKFLLDAVSDPRRVNYANVAGLGS